MPVGLLDPSGYPQRLEEGKGEKAYKLIELGRASKLTGMYGSRLTEPCRGRHPSP